MHGLEVHVLRLNHRLLQLLNTTYTTTHDNTYECILLLTAGTIIILMNVYYYLQHGSGAHALRLIHHMLPITPHALLLTYTTTDNEYEYTLLLTARLRSACPAPEASYATKHIYYHLSYL